MAPIIQRKQINIDGLEIHYLTGGQGDPLLLIHGGSSGACSWLQNIEQLSRSYTVYMPDLPGFGLSQPLTGSFYIPEMVYFVDRFAQKLGLQRFHLLGHSFGGGIALDYVLKFPFKVTKLVLVSSMFLGKDIALWVRLCTWRALIRPLGWLTVKLFRSLKWLTSKLFSSLNFTVPVSEATLCIGRGISGIRGQTGAMADRLAEIMVPTLVIWGDKDPVLPYRHAYAAAKLIPDCQVNIFKGSGHSVYRDRVDEFSLLLRNFLA